MANTIASITLQAILAFITLGGFTLAIVGIALGYDTTHLEDNRIYRNWWPLALEAFVALGVLVGILTDTLNCHLNAAVAFLVLSTSVISSLAQNVLKDAKHLLEFQSLPQDSTHAYLIAAGLVVLAVVNCVGILFLSFRVTSKERTGANWSKEKIVVVAVVGTLLATGWGVQLGGSILKQIDCVSDGTTEEQHECSYDLRYEWWVLALQLVVMVWLLVAIVVGTFDKMAVAIAAFLTIATSNLLDLADGALTDLVNHETIWSDLMAAGTLVLCIMNMVLLIILCWAGVVCANKHSENPEAQAGESMWTISTGVCTVPLLLGLGMALTGVSRLHISYCETGCMNLFRSAYWAAAFELFVLVCICCLAIFKRSSLPKVRGFVETFLVLASLEAMREVGTLLSLNEADMGILGPFGGSTSQGIGAAGFMIVTAMNLVLMLVIGCEHVVSYQYSGYTAV